MSKKILNTKNGKFYLNDEPFFLVSGDIHYFRIHEAYWKERLTLMKDFGLTAIQTYCPWNLHEPQKGVFNFEGMLNLGRFLDLANEIGLYVLLRPSPYICSECDCGGLPSRLKADRTIALRTCDEKYLKEVRDYYEEFCKIIIPRLSTNGGPIIAVGVENEFGDIAQDFEYLEAIAEMLTENGVDVPFYTTNGSDNLSMYNGTFKGALFNGHNFRSDPGNCQKALDVHNAVHPEKPFFIGELWCGRSMYWGNPFSHRNPEDLAQCFKECLELGAYVNFYMFAGGTNFGSFSGGIVGKSFEPRPNTPSKFIAHATSYDADALISEHGEPTEKYFLCRDVLDEFLNKPKREHLKPNYKTQSVTDIKLCESAYLFDNLDALCENETDAPMPLYMEDIGQDYGFILYSKYIDSFGAETSGELSIFGLRDRATVYLNGEYIGFNMRDENTNPISCVLPEEGAKLDVLVENIARVNTGITLYDDRKGIETDIRFCLKRLANFKHRSITLKDISGLKYVNRTNVTDNMPVFLRGQFDAECGVDTFVHTEGFTRGHIWINGFDLGRYWNIGPQMTLYVPGVLLKEKDNIIEIFDLHPKNNKKTINFIDHPLLEMD